MILTNLDALDRATSKRVKYLRQRASITGMGNKSFDDAVNLAKIQAIFKRTIGNQLEEGPVYSDFTGLSTPLIDTSHQETIKVTTRAYFWEKKKNEVDPHGFLLQAAGGAYVHTTDNKVYYYKKPMSKEGKIS